LGFCIGYFIAGSCNGDSNSNSKLLEATHKSSSCLQSI